MQHTKPPLTERNWFDDWLKKPLWRDLVFRCFILLVLSGLSIYFAKNDPRFTPVAFFIEVSGRMIPLLNSVGVLAIFVSLSALLFKDLERLHPERYDQSKIIGKIGAIIRRFSSDMTLWMLGMFFTFLCSLLFAVGAELYAHRVSMTDAAILTFFFIFLILGIFVSGIINVLIRRQAAPLADTPVLNRYIDRPTKAFAFWSFIFWMLFIAIQYAS